MRIRVRCRSRWPGWISPSYAVDYCTAHVDWMGVGRTDAVEREAIRHNIAETTTEVDAVRLLIRRTVGEIERAGKARIEPVPRA